MSYSHGFIPLLLNTDKYNKPFLCQYFLWLMLFFPVSRLMILVRSVQPYVDCSNKNYTKEKYKLPVDCSQGWRVYCEEACGSKNYVCHCVAWPTL